MKIIKVLILGKGYVGTQLYNQLEKSENIKASIVSREMLNYHSQSVLEKYLYAHDIEYVINCAGFTGRPNVDECELKKWECWYLNTVVPFYVNRACNNQGVEYIHISSGCIYNGYDKEWSEEDVPNFGVDCKSSFYSYSKHAFEERSKNCCIVRVRMPFDDNFKERSYLHKIIKYNNLIDYKNSKTYIPDLCRFIEVLITSRVSVTDIGIINFVNPNCLFTSEVTHILKSYGLYNKDWRFVSIDNIPITAPRSNCMLSINKLSSMFPNFEINNEEEAIRLACKSFISQKGCLKE